MTQLFKIFKIFTPSQLKKCELIFILMVVGSILEAFGVGLILPLISLMENTNFLLKHQELANILSKVGIKTHIEFIMLSSVGLIVFYFFKNLFIGIEYKIQIGYTMKLQSYFMDKILESYLNKPYEFYLKNNPALIQRNILSSTGNVFVGVLIPTFQLFTELITSFFICVMIVFMDVFTASILGVFMFLVLYIILKTLRKNISKHGVYQTRYAEAMYKWTNQAIGAVKETKVLRKEAFFLKSFHNACSLYCSSLNSFNFISQLPRLFVEFLAVIGLLGIVLVKLSLGEKPMDIVPLMGLLALSAFRLLPSVNRIIGNFNSIKFHLPNLELLFDEFLKIKEQNNRERLFYSTSIDKKLPFKDKIVIKDIKYSYPSEENSQKKTIKYVLNHVNVVIPKGKFVGIIGESGAGKTTFVDVLLGLLRPVSGKIYVDGTDIYSSLRGWQANLSYVPQSIYLIDGTIKENIALGKRLEDIDDDDINRVLAMAELTDFIENLPKGLYTEVGDRGVRLSGGQRQRLGIARALYAQPEVLILDEATSALDSNTEKSIMKTILKLKGKITIISIAHRISTLEECDFKIRFENGAAHII